MTTPMLEPQHDNGEKLPIVIRAAGVIGLAGAVILIRMPFWMLILVIRSSRWLGMRKPTVQRVGQLITGVQRAARFYPGRVACLEVSIATRLAGFVIGQPPTWCIGARFRPMIIHAWVEVNGRPVGELDTEKWSYQPALRL